MWGPKPVLAVLGLALVTVYLFVTAPEPLAQPAKVRTVSVDVLFELAEHENDVARAIYTEEIVGPGLGQGWTFTKDWDREDALGPLPAVFLRTAAARLEKHTTEMSLFLGSDNPINPANQFKGEQARGFERMRKSGASTSFYAGDIGRHTGMFPDIAVVETCADCHNENESSPKRDWRVGDLMGATSWTYPRERLPLDEVLQALAALQEANISTYASIVTHARQASIPAPVISNKWPREGNFLPTPEEFGRELHSRASTRTRKILLEAEVVAP